MIDRPREEVVSAMNEADEDDEEGGGRQRRQQAGVDIDAIRKDLRQVADTINKSTAEARRVVEEQVREHPYRTLGIAAAAGYVIGGGLPSSITRLAARAGMRALMSMAVGHLAAGVLGDERALAKVGGSDEPVEGSEFETE